MKPCLMCNQMFDEAALDFVGRCEPCFRAYLAMEPGSLPDLGVPFTPVSKAVK